jgi:hypothetical protein
MHHIQTPQGRLDKSCLTFNDFGEARIVVIVTKLFQFSQLREDNFG